LRIAIVNWSSRKVGGAETYLDRAVGGLRCAGHETAFFCEMEAPAFREPIGLPRDTPLWCASTIGRQAAISALRGWRPDVIYAHGLRDPDLEMAILDLAPGVFFAHGYRGTCISGAKTFKFPVARPCDRRFGWRCLLQFYPRRCGGLNPLTMLNDFRLQSSHLSNLRSYRAIATASRHMKAEYLKHGFEPEAIRVLPLPIEAPAAQRSGESEIPVIPGSVLFVGRMEVLKGGAMLLDALPHVCRDLQRSIHVKFVGDGSQRRRWETKAARIMERERKLKVEFTGWLEGGQLSRVIRQSDLLVVPSLWPEPFGLVGPELGSYGIPAVAFKLGGIPDWLTDGFNGYLAPADPPTPDGLGDAIIKCLKRTDYDVLREAAVASANRFSIKQHTDALLDLLAHAGSS
jgi:glycosyltransferase involved in cell wall biosynthesis